MNTKNVCLVKKFFGIAGMILTIILTVLSTIIFFSLKWMFQTWNNLTMDELVYHLSAPLDGTNEGMIREYVNVCVTPTVLVLLFVLIVFIAWRKKKRYYAAIGVGIAASIVIAGGSIYNAWTRLDVGVYMDNQGEYSTFIDDYYVDPVDVEITFPEEKRNLIYIFLESMEITYADEENGGAFEENVIPELTEIAQMNEDFSGESDELNGGYSMPGTTWTMGAMFAHTSGLPLNVSIGANDMDTQDTFFPGIITLGDILEKEGYSQTLLIGSEAVFGGRQLYFTEHGNYDIVDYTYAVQNGMIPEDYRVWWGYEDQKLFEFAKEKLLEVSDQGNPFNLTLLTVDTHFEDGYVCELCPDIYGDNTYANVMACSSGQVEEFIEWIQQQSFYENTTIVLVGDHPTMDSDFCEDVDESYDRKVYTAYINPAVEIETDARREYTTFESFPTVLASLGVNIEGNRLGLGTNLFSATQTLTERMGNSAVEKGVSGKSKLMEELANIDEDKEELLIREGKMPTSTIWAEAYERDTGALPVVVTDIANVGTDIAHVLLAVWTAEDQSDLQWIEMESREDGSYYARINVPSFGFKLGDYKIDVYVVDEVGDQYIIGSTIGIVD